MSKTTKDLSDYTKQYPNGVFTPQGDVLCYECHGNVFKNVIYDSVSNSMQDRVYNVDSKEWKALIEAQPLIPYKTAVTTCNRCEKRIQLDRFTAKVNNEAKEIRQLGILNAKVWQTGGMNCAIGFDVNPSIHVLIIDCNDGEREYYYVGTFDDEGEETKEVNKMFDDFEEVKEYIRANYVKDYIGKCTEFLKRFNEQMDEMHREADNNPDVYSDYDIFISVKDNKIRIPINADSYERLIQYIEDEITETLE